MDFSFWHDLWQTGRIGFHEGQVNANLKRHVDRLISPHASGILVPLCGKSVDLTWLEPHFEHVVGVEFVDAAARAYFSERGIDAIGDDHTGLRRYRGAGVTLLAADFHDVTLDHTGPIHRVFDRASMIALPRDVRPRYVAHLTSLLPHGGVILLVTLCYDEAGYDGPPFSVDEDEVRALYSATCEIELLARAKPTELPEALAALGVTSDVWLITKR